MKRLHVHLSVDNLEQNVNFYSAMFGCQPTVEQDDYAKWMLDDPRVNFAISNRSKKLGLDHLGIQAETESELQGVKQLLDATQVPIETQDGMACCYSQSDKHWVTDPQGIAWESFQTLNDIPTFNGQDSESESDSACCPAPAPETKKKSSCCG